METWYNLLELFVDSSFNLYQTLNFPFTKAFFRSFTNEDKLLRNISVNDLVFSFNGKYLAYAPYIKDKLLCNISVNDLVFSFNDKYLAYTLY